MDLQNRKQAREQRRYRERAEVRYTKPCADAAPGLRWRGMDRLSAGLKARGCRIPSLFVWTLAFDVCNKELKLGDEYWKIEEGDACLETIDTLRYGLVHLAW